MRKSIVLLIGVGGSLNVFAQANLTLYGTIDNGIAYISNVASTHAVQGHSVFQTFTSSYGNRWGFRGVEDLGGGLSAVFTLENGFDGYSGKILQGGREWGRQAFVGLSSTSFGTLTLGRQYDVPFEFVGQSTSWTQWAGQYGAHVGDNDNLFQTFREQNSVKYKTVNYGGLQGGLMYAFSNQQGAFANNRAYNVAVRYANGPITLAAGYVRLDSPSAGQTAGNNAGGAVGGEYALGASTLFYNAGPVGVQAVATAAISYKVGLANVSFVFSNSRFDYTDASNLRLNNFELNSSYMITPSILLGAAYTLTDGQASGGHGDGYAQGNTPKWHQLNLGVNYALSKRSGIHFLVAYQRAAGSANAASINATGNVTGAGTNNVKLALLGLYHRF